MRSVISCAVVLVVGCGGAAGSDASVPDAPSIDAGPMAPPEAMTEHGPVVGRRGEGFQAFLGIPYAAPPIGALRWRMPEPPEPWTDPRLSTNRPPRCAQSGFGIPLASQEDCLYLNVHTPDPRPERAPVMVWIHGGGFVFGEGVQADEGTSGDLLAARHGAVVVSMNYRLGPFGFMAHAALSAESGTSGNFGLADQRAALEWVQANIAAFGGDPDNVTIFGESAGGLSVCAHLVSPGSAGLFHRAISQSGLCDSPLVTRAEAEVDGAVLSTALGCEGSADVASCLRAASMETIHAADAEGSGAFQEIGRRAPWRPIVDGAFLPGDFRSRVEAGEVHRVPTVIGWNRDEGTLFVMLAEQAGSVADEASYAEVTAGLADYAGVSVDAVRAQYPLADYPDPGAAVADALGHVSLACPSRRAARLLAEHGVEVRVYYFTYPDAAFQLTATRALGAFHSAEIQYVFGHPASLGRTSFRGDDVPLNEALSGYWTRFARGGDPNGAGAPAWPAYDLAGEAHLELDRTIAASSRADTDACALWDP